MEMKEDKMVWIEHSYTNAPLTSIKTQLDLSEEESALIHAYIIEAMAIIDKNIKIVGKKQAELRIKKSRG